MSLTTQTTTDRWRQRVWPTVMSQASTSIGIPLLFNTIIVAMALFTRGGGWHNDYLVYWLRLALVLALIQLAVCLWRGRLLDGSWAIFYLCLTGVGSWISLSIAGDSMDGGVWGQGGDFIAKLLAAYTISGLFGIVVGVVVVGAVLLVISLNRNRQLFDNLPPQS